MAPCGYREVVEEFSGSDFEGTASVSMFLLVRTGTRGAPVRERGARLSGGRLCRQLDQNKCANTNATFSQQNAMQSGPRPLWMGTMNTYKRNAHTNAHANKETY